MKYVEIIADSGSADTIKAIADKAKAEDLRVGVIGEDGMQQTRLLLNDEELQGAVDMLQNVLGAQPTARVTVLSVEMFLPKTEVETQKKKKSSKTAAREALYEEVRTSAELDRNFIVLVILSTIVAAIALIENNVAVVIGAMVIAPLLGPNLALSVGTALGDTALVAQSAKTLAVGILLAIALSTAIGYFWNFENFSPELISRTIVGVDSAVLALASGAAAALSLTTRLSSVLVGVMVAVALLPPATTLGIMLGKGNFLFAVDAGLLLAVNIVSVNLASKIVFWAKGVSPRTWYEKEKAKKAMRIYLIAWFISLLALMIFIYTRMEIRLAS
jgi:uncharacterized hydrophobic protein (TIGR00341 family)